MESRPDLLFHQQYPTRYGSKVTRCQMPSDKVPPVTRLTPKPQGDGVSASIKRRWGWMDGMVNRCELSINVVTRGKPKMLRGLGQKGTVAGTGSCHYPVKDNQQRCGYGGGKKRRPSCNWTDTGCACLTGNMTRRASGQTSLRCLGTRT